VLIERGRKDVPFNGARPGGAFDAAGRSSGVGVEEHGQPGDGAFIVFPFAAHVTDPGGEIWHSDQFLSQPGEVGDVPEMHYTRGTFIAGRGIWGWRELPTVHFTLHDSGTANPCEVEACFA